MKYVEPDKLEKLTGRRLMETESFHFDCYPGIACFNRCCRNLNLFLYPYDVIRLKSRLNMSSDQFLEQYVDIVLRADAFFPDVLLKMSENTERDCCFLSVDGCNVYPDRPDTCRKFPMEQGVLFHGPPDDSQRVYFFRPPPFCEGPRQKKIWTPEKWNLDPEDAHYDQMTLHWAGIRRLMQDDPWAGEGPEGSRAKMTFMAAYNIDGFRSFIFKSSFLKRYHVKPALLKQIKKNDVKLLTFAFSWIRFFLWGRKSNLFRLRV